jgi:hypothetical protein
VDRCDLRLHGVELVLLVAHTRVGIPDKEAEPGDDYGADRSGTERQGMACER